MKKIRYSSATPAQIIGLIVDGEFYQYTRNQQIIMLHQIGITRAEMARQLKRDPTIPWEVVRKHEDRRGKYHKPTQVEKDADGFAESHVRVMIRKQINKVLGRVSRDYVRMAAGIAPGRF